MSDSDDEIPTLSGSALDALKEFYADRDERQKKFEDLKAIAEENTAGREGEGKMLSMDVFAEDWNESQFWYSDDTAMKLAKELLRGATGVTTLAVVSAPSVFVQLKNLITKSGKSKDESPKIWLLEYDTRFEVFPEFVFYDFNTPMHLPPHLKGTVDHIIVDPPFLSEDCQTKAATTVRWLTKPSITPRLIACTGERMSSLITRVYRSQGVKTTDFEVVHSKGLSNEFFCYANFECEEWKWKVEASPS